MRQKKPPKVSSNDLSQRRDQLTIVELRWANHRSAFGRTTVICECPFCHYDQIAYLWSLAGGGKRCEVCNAMLYQTQAIQFTNQIRVPQKATVEPPVTSQAFGHPDNPFDTESPEGRAFDANPVFREQVQGTEPPSATFKSKWAKL